MYSVFRMSWSNLRCHALWLAFTLTTLPTQPRISHQRHQPRRFLARIHAMHRSSLRLSTNSLPRWYDWKKSLHVDDSPSLPISLADGSFRHHYLGTLCSPIHIRMGWWASFHSFSYVLRGDCFLQHQRLVRVEYPALYDCRYVGDQYHRILHEYHQHSFSMFSVAASIFCTFLVYARQSLLLGDEGPNRGCKEKLETVTSK